MRVLKLVAITATLLASAASASAQGTIKVGLIMPYSGIFADTSTQMDGGVKLFLQQNGDTVAGKKVEILRRDVGGVAPDVAKRLAQELVVRDKVDILAGFVLTPNAMAASDVSAEAKVPLVIMNAATSIITTKSPYNVRVSMTLPQVVTPLAQWAVKQNIKNVFTMVSDYGPGIDADTAFQKAFKAAGGEVVGSVRMPVANPDFSPFVQRAKDSNAQSVFVFIPAGTQPASLMKSLVDRGLTPDKVKIMASGELTDDSALKNLDNSAVGVITAYHYDHTHKSSLNESFVKAYRAANNNENPNLLAVGGYDGMRLIYDVLKKTGGKADGETFITAAKGMSWESPRGQITIDPETRDIVQTMYIRQLESVNGRLQNAEIDKTDNVKDPVKAEMKN